MGNRYATGNKAISECDRCGFRYKLRQLRDLVIKDHDVNIKVCPECWEMDHPQLKLGTFPVDDPQAIRDPRPDFTGYPQSREQLVPVLENTATGFIGNVTIRII